MGRLVKIQLISCENHDHYSIMTMKLAYTSSVSIYRYIYPKLRGLVGKIQLISCENHDHYSIMTMKLAYTSSVRIYRYIYPKIWAS